MAGKNGRKGEAPDAERDPYLVLAMGITWLAILAAGFVLTLHSGEDALSGAVPGVVVMGGIGVVQVAVGIAGIRELKRMTREGKNPPFGEARK